MVRISMNVPDDLVEDLRADCAAVGGEILLAAAFYWCRRGDLSTSKAARLAGLTYAEFLEAATQRGAVLYDYGVEEVQAEISRPLPEGVDFEAIKQDIARAQAARG